MNLAQLQAAVITETNRPDLVAETLQAVLEATLSIHNVDFWVRDRYEVQVVFTAPGYIQYLDTTLIANFRAVSYLRKSDIYQFTGQQAPGNVIQDPNSAGPRRYDFLTRVDMGDILDTYGYEKVDVWYQAGSQVNIKSSTSLQYLIVGCYLNPVIAASDAEGYSSWIAAQYPYAIVYRAAGSIFQKIGETSSAANYLRPPSSSSKTDEGGMYYSQLKLIQNTQILAQGW